MIVVFIGQPCSGKTTLAKEFQKKIFHNSTAPIIDGDDIRVIFNNTDYSKEGRIKNLNRISDISTFLASKYHDVIVSAIYPFIEAREYLESISTQKILWVYLKYNGVRGRENFHVEFETPSIEIKNLMMLNTSSISIEDCVSMVYKFYSNFYYDTPVKPNDTNI